MKSPNVLILFTDQQRHDTVGAAGFDYMITPNLDRLAKDGCLYINAHTSNPVCMPARHDLLTGLPARAHGYYGNKGKMPIKDYGIPTLPRLLSEKGYRTVAIGKMHFSPPRMHHGFNELFLMETLPKANQDDQYTDFLDKEGIRDIQNIHGIKPHIYHIPQNAMTDEMHHGTAWIANKAIEWLEKNNNEHPFFMMCGWLHPHPPWNIPKEFDDIYKDKNIPEATPISRSYPFDAEAYEWYGDNDTSEQKRKIREAYLTSITMVDKHVGRILDYLKETNLLDNTLIIFTSDHGEMLQDKGYFGKHIPYDASVRIPFIVRYPKAFPEGLVKKEFVDLLDIMPTCLEQCDIEYNDTKYTLPGKSLCSKDINERRYQFSSSGFLGEKRWIMCRNERYKYIYYYNQGTEELYDMLSDKNESCNLLFDKEYPIEIYNKLRLEAVKYEEKWGPEGAVFENDFIKVDAQHFHAEHQGKYKLIMNSQTQNSRKKDSEVFAERLISEMEYALSNFEKSQVKLQEVFNNEEWRQDLTSKLSKLGLTKDMESKLFKQ